MPLRPPHPILSPARLPEPLLALRLTPLFVLSLVLLSLSLAGCAGQAPRKDQPVLSGGSGTLGRADPGFLQWLERQSLLGAAPEAAVVVSGSEIGWRAPGSPPVPSLLLTEADMWLSVEPRLLLTGGKRSALEELAQPPVFEALRACGIRGVYLRAAAEAGAVWGYDRAATTTGNDITGHGFAEDVGTEEDFSRLAHTASKSRTLLASDLVPAATGLGPDFFLAARGVRDYPGLYCAIEIPRDLWGLLPPPEGEWRGVALDASQTSALVERGILPARLARDALVWAATGGWASTGEVRGADGTLRRWVYRFHQKPGRPVLNWNDPSATARRTLSASAIRQVGLRRLPLVGLEIAPLAGQEAGGATVSTAPLPEAARSLGREVRRYGGWTWMRDMLPFADLQDIMPDGPDFATSPVTTTTVEHALLTEDASALRDCIDSALESGLEFRRFVNTLPSADGIDYSLPQMMAAGHRPLSPGGLPGAVLQAHMVAGAHRRIGAWGEQAPFIGDVLYVNATTLSAIAAGFTPAQAAADENVVAIVRNHLFLAAFKAAQPGLFMLPADNLAGTLPLTWEHVALRPESWRKEQAARGAGSPMPPISGLAITRGGVPRAPAAYPPVVVQKGIEGSFVSGMARLASLRTATGVAQGIVVARPATRGEGSVALLTRLPGDRGHILTIANFAATPTTEHIRLERTWNLDAGTRGKDMLDETFMSMGTDMQIPMAARQCRVILLR